MGTKPTVTFKYKSTDTQNPPYTLTSGYIQRVDWSIGRQNITDNYSGAGCNVYGRDISVITGANAPAIGDQVEVQILDPSSSPNQGPAFYGFISDIKRIYGQIANLDTWQITIEGPIGRSGRNTMSYSTLAGDNTSLIANAIVNQNGTLFDGGGGGMATVSTQTLEGQVPDLLNVWQSTEQGYIQEAFGYVTVSAGPPVVKTWVPQARLYPRYGGTYTTISYNFADDGTSYDGVAAVKFTEIEFLTAAQNYGSKVVVQSDGLADQSSGTGTYVQTVSTISQTTSVAANTAGYLKVILDNNATVPYRLSFSGATNPTTGVPSTAAMAIKQWCRIKFRGNEYFTVIEGADFSATPTDYNIDLYFSSSLQNAFFTLDSVVAGVLNTNKLG